MVRSLATAIWKGGAKLFGKEAATAAVKNSFPTTVTAVGETALAAEATNAVSKIGSVANAGQVAAAEAGIVAGEAAAAAGDAANAAASAAKTTSAVADTVAAEGRLANVRSAARALLGKKLDYVFGRATGSAHNVERSQAMLAQLERVGLPDSAASRAVLQRHLDAVLNDASNVVRAQTNGNVVRESLLLGPRGALKVQSIWDGAKLITVQLFGGGG